MKDKPEFRKIWLQNIVYLATGENVTANRYFKTPYDRAITAHTLFHYVYLTFERNHTMTKKTSRNAKTSWGVTFVSWLPNAEDKEAIKAWMATTPNMVEHLEDIIANGYKFSCSFDGENQTFIVALTNREAAVDFQGHCITFRHRDMYTCLAIACWFELEFTIGDWSVVGDTSRFDW